MMLVIRGQEMAWIGTVFALFFAALILSLFKTTARADRRAEKWSSNVPGHQTYRDGELMKPALFEGGPFHLKVLDLPVDDEGEPVLRLNAAGGQYERTGKTEAGITTFKWSPERKEAVLSEDSN